MKTLGKVLKESRTLIPLTLRQVEEATGISNAYLSQLENEKIKKPSANVLYKLSNLYNLELDYLLTAAGVLEKHTSTKNKILNKVSFSSKDLTEDEEKALLDYLNFIRNREQKHV